MTTAAEIGYGTTLEWNTKTVLDLTRIGSVKLTVSKLDSSDLNSPDYFKEIKLGFIDPGDVEIEGFFRPDDTYGQRAMLNDCRNRISRDFIIHLPTALSTTTWNGTAYITTFEAGDATPEGLIPMRATMSITGEPHLGVGASTGMSALTGIEENGPGDPLVFNPTFAIAKFAYVVDVNTASNWIQLIPIAVDHTITITCGTQVQTVASGGTAQVTIGGTGTVTLVSVKVRESGKSAKTYNIYVYRA